MITEEQYFELVNLQAQVYCQLHIYSSNDKQLLNPILFGSGFLASYKNKPFLITADHNLHFDDYDNKEERTGNEYIIAIVNNVNKDLSTVLTPLGGFYYGEQLCFNKKEAKLIDISVCLLKEINFQFPFLTHEISINNNSRIIVQAGVEKNFYDATLFTEPNTNQKYTTYGVVHNDIKGIIGKRTNALYCDISYNSTCGNYYNFLFSSEMKYEDWAGISGAPVFDYEGNIVGVVHRISENGIWVTPIKYATMLMDLALKQEN